MAPSSFFLSLSLLQLRGHDSSFFNPEALSFFCPTHGYSCSRISSSSFIPSIEFLYIKTFRAPLLTASSATSTAVMRYMNWDVLLFPDGPKVPLQEFKTGCFVTQDPGKLTPRFQYHQDAGVPIALLGITIFSARYDANTDDRRSRIFCHSDDCTTSGTYRRLLCSQPASRLSVSSLVA